MDFRQLHYITTVAEFKSITKAANALYISQPSLSHFISKTEDEMGVKIFDRNTYPISLTYAGEKYIQTAYEILRLNEELKRNFRDISESKKGRIRIGIPTERAGYMLPLVLPRYHEKYPEIEIKVFESKTENLIDSVLKGKTDFVIFPYHVEESSLVMETIYEEELLLVTSHNIIKDFHLFPKKDDVVDLTKIDGLPFILLRKGHGIRTAVDKLFKRYSIKPNILMETGSNIAAYRLAATGMGIAIVPAMTVNLSKCIDDHPKIYSMTEIPITWKVVVAYRKDAYIGTAERDFFEIAREIFIKNNHTEV